MKKVTKIIALVAVLLAAAAVISGCSGDNVTAKGNAASPSASSSAARVSAGRVQVDDRGNVTVAVEWGGPDNSSLAFNVSMNTHSVDLDNYDLAELATLKDDSGNEYRPVRWDSAPGGHHRKGTLTFPLPESLQQNSTGILELVIRDIAGIEERVFRW